MKHKKIMGKEVQARVILDKQLIRYQIIAIIVQSHLRASLILNNIYRLLMRTYKNNLNADIVISHSILNRTERIMSEDTILRSKYSS